MTKNTEARDRAMANIKANLSCANEKFSETRDQLNAPLVSDLNPREIPALTMEQAAQVKNILNGVGQASLLMNKINEQLAVYGFPVKPLLMHELSTLSYELMLSLTETRKELNRIAPSLVGGEIQTEAQKIKQHLDKKELVA